MPIHRDISPVRALISGVFIFLLIPVLAYSAVPGFRGNSPRFAAGLHRGPYQGSPEQAARMFLQTASAVPQGDLILQSIQQSPAGQHVRFRQTLRSVPVIGSSVVVSINPGGFVTAVADNSMPGISIASVTPSVSSDNARAAARQALADRGRFLHGEQSELMIDADDGAPRLVWRVITPMTCPGAEWETLVDASTGAVVRSRDIAVHDRSRPRSAAGTVNGSGYVFNPDPLTTAHQYYNSVGFINNNNADSPELNAQRILVTLRDISYNGYEATLDGPYVSIQDWDAPFTPVVTAVDPDSFRFTRSQDGFGDVMVYFQIDSSQRYLRSLGFTGIQYLPIVADAQGDSGRDNSYYAPGNNRLSFGTGGVPDAQDADVIWHEYGHAIENWIVPGWGGADEGAMGEGFGDYWAASYSRAIDPVFSRNFVFTWDAGLTSSGNGAIWSGRILNDARTYPPAGVADYEVHDAGQIWSSVLMQLWDDLGRNVMDQLVIQHHYYMTTRMTMPDAALAILQADRDIFGGIHLHTLINRFNEHEVFIGPAAAGVPHKDSENLTAPFPVVMTVTAGTFPVDSASARLICWRDSLEADTILMSWSGVLQGFTGAIPAAGVPAMYHYYCTIADTTGHLAFVPAGAPLTVYSFFAGIDTIPPVARTSLVSSQSILFWNPVLHINATDNLGIKSVTVPWDVPARHLSGTINAIPTGPDIYDARFPLDTTQVTIGDTVFYRIVVSDLAAAPNIISIPDTGNTWFVVTLASILLVGNEGTVTSGPTSPGLFARTLAPKGFLVDQIDFINDAFPKLSNFDLVIMSAGIRLAPFVVNAKVQAVTDYVAAGGRAIVEGGNVGYQHRAGGPMAGSLYFRRLVMHDSAWVSDVTNSSLVFTSPQHPLFRSPNPITGPLTMTSRTATADRDAMQQFPDDPGADIVAGWSELPASAAIVVYTPPGETLPRTIMFNLALGSLTDTAAAKALIENAVSSFLPPRGATDVQAGIGPIPRVYALYQNFPNPFNPATAVQYDVPAAGRVTISIFNILGEKIATLTDGIIQPGRHTLRWDASGFAGGVYFYRLAAGGTTFTRKMLLIR